MTVSCATDESTPSPSEMKGWRRRVRLVTEKLIFEYGTPRHGNPTDPLDELIYALFSKKTPPMRYQPIFEDFRATFKPWTRLLSTDVEELANELRPLGMAQLRAQQVFNIALQLQNDFHCVSLAPLLGMRQPDVHAYLLGLPGVGEKIARCVMMYAMGMDISPMDAHATRLLTRLGLLPRKVTALQAHRLVDERMPPGLAYSFHVTAIAHGREVCGAKNARCTECVLTPCCAFRSGDSTVASPEVPTWR